LNYLGGNLNYPEGHLNYPGGLLELSRGPLTSGWRRMSPLPKSVMRMCMEPLSRMFSGLRSRCTIPVHRQLRFGDPHHYSNADPGTGQC
jgi:hypothetical protein